MFEFQSTLPRGERRNRQCRIPAECDISIHAPARGATISFRMHSWPCSNFNPRSREGSDDYKQEEVNMGIDFNPRSREGSDNTTQSPVCIIWDFNPRSREGSDTEEYCKLPNKLISIHAPARGATRFSAVVGMNLRISIHAPARGATAKSVGSLKAVVISIHAPARGATYRLGIAGRGKNISIHAPARGATILALYQLSPQILFQSTLPRGERPARSPFWMCMCNFNPRSREGSDDSCHFVAPNSL